MAKAARQRCRIRSSQWAQAAAPPPGWASPAAEVGTSAADFLVRGRGSQPREQQLAAEHRRPVRALGSPRRGDFRHSAEWRVTNVQILQSSGNASVDTSAVRAIQSSNPVNPLPKRVSAGNKVSVEFWFDFRR